MTMGTTWYMLDANTGNLILTLKNVPSGTAVTDQDGSQLRFSYNANTGNILCWNSSQSIQPAGPTGTAQQQWKPMVGAVIDAVNDTIWYNSGPNTVITTGTPWFTNDILPRSGYTMNVTGTKGLPALVRVLQDEKYVPKIMIFNDMRNLNTWGSTDMYFMAAAVRIDDHVAPYSPLPDKTATQNNNLGFGATLLWNRNITKPLGGNLTFSLGPMSYEDKIFTLYSKETMQWWGYSVDTGDLIWGPTASQSPWDVYGSGGFYANDMLFSGGYGGVLHAYNMNTGNELWNYTLSAIGHESPYGNYQLTLGGIADGKVYIYSMEHSPTQPLWRGSYLRCINQTDGTEIWKSLHFVSGFSGGAGIVEIADGCIVAGNDYDNRMYVYGKGPSAATVAGPDTVQPLGTSILLTGTVTDVSQGAKEFSQSRGLSVPAIADADQQAWMEYMYSQQVMPTNAKGVEVSLDSVDPNGNFVHIGTTTSDMNGMFKMTFTPEVPGEYTIIATFAGSESYYSSYAQTAIGVSEAAPTVAPTAAPEQSAADLYFVPAIAGLFVAIIVVGLLIILVLRKRA